MSVKPESPSPSVDPELKAMGLIGQLLDELSDDAKQRVLQWAANRYLPLAKIGASFSQGSKPNAASEDQPFEDLPALFEATNPTTDVDKALVVAYWFQQIQQNQDFASQIINSELKHLGHAVSNITSAFTSLMNNKYALQVRKSGKSQQARKKYKLTLAGIKKVQEMIANKH